MNSQFVSPSVHLCADQIVIDTIEPCTSEMSLREIGDLGATYASSQCLRSCAKTPALLEAITRLPITSVEESFFFLESVLFSCLAMYC